MNLNKHKLEELELDMTPMIDVVFLLIIFFILITDMTQQDLEALTLPKARMAQPDEPDAKEYRPVINIHQTGKMVIKKNDVFDPTTGDQTLLKQSLLDMARRMKSDHINQEEQSGRMIPDDFLLVRADRFTPFHYIQEIMTACGTPGIAIWKIQLAAGTAEEATGDAGN